MTHLKSVYFFPQVHVCQLHSSSWHRFVENPFFSLGGGVGVNDGRLVGGIAAVVILARFLGLRTVFVLLCSISKPTDNIKSLPLCPTAHTFHNCSSHPLLAAFPHLPTSHSLSGQLHRKIGNACGGEEDAGLPSVDATKGVLLHPTNRTNLQSKAQGRACHPHVARKVQPSRIPYPRLAGWQN